MSKGFIWSLVAILIGVVVVCILPTLSMRHPSWNCSKQEINIKTGQARDSRYIAGIRLSEKTHETALSLVLTGSVDVANIREWHTVNTFSPPWKNYSPHYRFHGALAQAHEAGSLFTCYELPQTTRTEIAINLLAMWQTNGSYFAAGEYIRQLEKNISRNTCGAAPSEGGGLGVQ